MGTLKHTWYTDKYIAECYSENGGVGEERDNGAIAQTERQLSIDKNTIRSALQRLGIKRKKVSAKDIAMIVMRKEGKNNQQIASYFGCSPGYVSRILTANGFRTRVTKNQTDDMAGGKYNNRHFHRGKNKGYYWVRIEDNDPMASMRTKGGLVLEHRLVLARKIGRPLRAEEQAHHIDGNRANNNPDNLQLRQGKHGAGIAYCCKDCGSKNIVPCELEGG